MLYDPNNEADWGTQPIVDESPILAKRVNCLGTPRVTSGLFGVVTAGKPVHTVTALKII